MAVFGNVKPKQHGDIDNDNGGINEEIISSNASKETLG